MKLNSVDKFEDIPVYYLEEGLPLYNILYGKYFKTMNPEEFMSQYKDSIRNNSPINEDGDDFLFALISLSQWSIVDLPIIVLDFVDSHYNYDYDKYKEDFPNYYELIIERIKFMKSYKEIICGSYHSIALRYDGTISMWGSNIDKQRKDAPEGISISYPTNDYPKDKFLKISCGNSHTLGLKIDGTVIMWGRDQRYNKTDTEFIDINCSYYHSAGIQRDGTVVVWDNYDNKQVDNILSGKFIKIICGYYHIVGLREDGTVVTCGYHKSIPKTPCGKFTQIACSVYYSVGIREDGTVITWDNNDCKQLNDNPKGKFIKVSCGLFHTVGLREDGTVVTWGNNDYFQRNDEPINEKFIDIACGKHYSVGIREDRTIAIWGSNRYNERNNTPIDGHLFSGRFIKITCGSYHSVALREDGVLITWGNDNWDQLTY